MNWEVSSMPLKTSFFNPTLFKKNLSRSWPLWGGVSAVGSLLPLYLILALNNDVYMRFYQEDFVEFLYQAAVYFLPAFTACYAILVAMFVWNYLNNSRSVGFMHSLAIDRKGLFVTNMLSGLSMLLIPYVIVGGLMCVIATCCGAMDIGAVMTTIAAVILETLLFFGMGTLCAAVTGNVIAAAVYYIILNFAVPMLDSLIHLLATEFIFGLTGSISDWSKWFAPVISLYDNVGEIYPEVNGVRAQLPVIENFWVIVLYGIVGVAMLAASYLLYRARRSESAGDVVAFSWLRPVFRFGIALISALTLGRMLYELFWNSLFSEGRYADMIPMAICMMISAIVGYYAASMLLEKSLRVFKGSAKGIALVCAATVAICLGVALDIFGLGRHIPEVENVDKVYISGHLDVVCDAEKYPDLCADIIELHEMIVADKNYIRDMDERWDWDGEEVRWRSVTIEYTLKNGSTVERYYYLPMTKARAKDPTTYDSKFLSLVTSPDVLIASVTLPDNTEFCYGYLEFYNPVTDTWENLSIEHVAWDIVYEALLRDAREGNFYSSKSLLWEEQLKYPAETTQSQLEATLWLEYRYGKEHRYGNLYVPLQPTMKHTLKALVSAGVLDQAILDGWLMAD